MAERKAKDFILNTVKAGGTGPAPFFILLRAAEKDDNLTGRIARFGHHYVHERSTSVELNNDDEQLQPMVDKLEDHLKDLVYDLNRELTAALNAELEYQQSDEAIIGALDANERHFDEETGKEVDLSEFTFIGLVPPGPFRDKILAHYTDLFDRSPEEVFQALVRRKVMFDDRGNRVDTSNFKLASELTPKLQDKICDKHRDWNTEDQYWAEHITDEWKERLEKMGFNRVEIAYSLGGSQGDGASFTADSIDMVKLLKHILHRDECRRQVGTLVNGLVG